MLYGRVLPSLWSISARMRISFGVVWFNNVFLVCMGPLKTPHDLTKKSLRSDGAHEN